MGSFRSPVQADASRGGRPPLNNPGVRPASPPLRGPFASSGFLTDRRDAPSLARTRLFATSLSLVLKSLIRSAVLTASPTPRCYFFFLCGVSHRFTFPELSLDSRQRSTKKHKYFAGGGVGRGVRSAEEQPEARMSRQDVGERTVRARDGESGRSAGRRA